MTGQEHLIHRYLRSAKRFPHVWCPGCGIGILLGALVRAIDSNGYAKDDIVLISGIGCSGRLPVYLDFNTLHTTHGRALTFATGIKLAKPSLKVIAIMGDGDAASIGGNHLIHSARRNIDITAIIINNQIYGMTGGQSSPTTPFGLHTASSPFGHLEHPFDIAKLVEGAGAAFVARSTVYHARILEKLIGKAVAKSGFSVVEVMSPCVTHFGKWSGMGSAVQMMQWQRDNTVSIEKARDMTATELVDKVVTGILVDVDKPTFHEEHARISREMRDTP